MKRMKNESFKDYHNRRMVANHATKDYLKGQFFHVSKEFLGLSSDNIPQYSKGKTYVKRNDQTAS